MEEFLDYLIKQIVTKPEEVKIEKEEKDLVKEKKKW